MTSSYMQATLTRHHWLALKRRRLHGDVVWLSEEGLTLVSEGRLPVGARVHITLQTQEHSLNGVPAQIVRAEPGMNGTRYSLRFHKQRVIDQGGTVTLQLLSYLAQNFKQ